MLRCGPAAAAQDPGSRRINGFHFPGKTGSIHIVDRLPAFVQDGKAGIRFCDDRDPGRLRHLPNHAGHCLRSGGTVGPHGIRAQALQDDRRRHRVRSVQASSILFKGHGYHHRKVRAGFLCCDEGGAAFLQAHHGFHHQQVHTRFRQVSDLLPVDIYQFFKIHAADRGKLFSCHGQISGDQRFRPRRPPGGLHQRQVQLPDLFFQTILGQLDPVGGKGRSIQDVGTGTDVFPLQSGQDVRMLRDPFFRADAARHASCHQVGACRSVQKNDPFFYAKISEFLFGHFHSAFPVPFPTCRFRKNSLLKPHPGTPDFANMKYSIMIFLKREDIVLASLPEKGLRPAKRFSSTSRNGSLFMCQGNTLSTLICPRSPPALRQVSRWERGTGNRIHNSVRCGGRIQWRKDLRRARRRCPA